MRAPGSARSRNPAGTSSSSGPWAARTFVPCASVGLISSATRPDYYVRPWLTRHRPLPPG